MGTVKHPVGLMDFSSLILQAEASKADVIVLANGAGDASNALKTANEYGLIKRGLKVMAMIFLDTDVQAAGLDIAQVGAGASNAVLLVENQGKALNGPSAISREPTRCRITRRPAPIPTR